MTTATTTMHPGHEILRRAVPDTGMRREWVHGACASDCPQVVAEAVLSEISSVPLTDEEIACVMEFVGSI